MVIDLKQRNANAYLFGLISVINGNNLVLHGHVSLPPMVEQVLEGV
jgi:hypothetical protein